MPTRWLSAIYSFDILEESYRLQVLISDHSRIWIIRSKITLKWCIERLCSLIPDEVETHDFWPPLAQILKRLILSEFRFKCRTFLWNFSSVHKYFHSLWYIFYLKSQNGLALAEFFNHVQDHYAIVNLQYTGVQSINDASHIVNVYTHTFSTLSTMWNASFMRCTPLYLIKMWILRAGVYTSN